VLTVVDYRAGNAPSVGYALGRLGVEHRLGSQPEDIATADRLVLPGVGSADATMQSLRDSGLLEPLEQRVRNDGVPFLGICVGLQVLFDWSEEGDTACLGWLPGKVRRFPATDRVPQIGWNEVTFRKEHPLALGEAGHFYFVNSYFAEPDDEDDVLASTTYGPTFASMVARDNIVAAQFHVEKSGQLGLRMLEAFTRS
jgi:glutamine amidotransferase